jgi:hypothetical protein
MKGGRAAGTAIAALLVQMQVGAAVPEARLTVACQPSARSGASSAATAVAFLTRADGHTDHLHLAAALDTIRRTRATEAVEALSALLPHQSRLYSSRDKALVVRLRAYLMLTLSDLGYPDSALPALYDTLVHVDERLTALEVASAVRAAGSLGPRGRELVPFLLDTLTDRFAAEEVSLQRYDSDFPPAEATTVSLETVRALGRICSAGDTAALEAIARLAASEDPRLAREARNTAREIAARGDQP